MSSSAEFLCSQRKGFMVWANIYALHSHGSKRDGLGWEHHQQFPPVQRRKQRPEHCPPSHHCIDGTDILSNTKETAKPGRVQAPKAS
jgi:hypothetical protein